MPGIEINSLPVRDKSGAVIEGLSAMAQSMPAPLACDKGLAGFHHKLTKHR